MSLPAELSYPKLKSSAVSSVATQFSLTPTNSGSTYAAGSTLSFDIPCGQRCTWLDPTATLLRFTVTSVLGGAAFGWDFLQSLSLYSSAGSTLIEQVNEYAALHTLQRDLATDATAVQFCDTITSNATTSRMRTPGAIAAGGSYTFSIPLISIIGSLSAGQLYLPLHALNAPLRLDLVTAAAVTAMGGIATGTPDYTISAPSLELTFITISDTAHAQISSMTGGQYTWNSSIWRQYRQVHAASQMSDTLMVPARFTSCTALFGIQRESAILTNKLNYSTADRIRNKLASYQVKIGSQFANAKPIDCSALAVDVLQQLKRVYSNATCTGYPTLFSAGYFNADTSASTELGSFAIGLELSPFSQVDKLLSGTNTVANNIQIDLNYSSAPLAATWDVYVQADALFTVSAQTGQMAVTF